MKQKKEFMWVKIEAVIPVDIGDTENKHFVVEENGCPATGVVGNTLMEIIGLWDEKSCCWACAFHGENTIVKDPDNAQELLKELQKLKNERTNKSSM